ncbi:hypothetical protein Tsubulata_044292 [Turnera subulata]|uniref:Galacturonokinase n=1 Tax=Turnera subulata TaxID=218843 RepID=A0A9Q0GHQ0_9ROSI|nr:hypothetical protein Tsubulata_044292 [Turnera subulata]
MTWPSEDELYKIKEVVCEMAGPKVTPEEVRVVVSPYRICPLGAHIDHQGGTVSAMTINRGILLGFVPSGDTKVVLRSGQFKGQVSFSVDEVLHPKPTKKKGENHETRSPELQEECSWGDFARGAVYSLKKANPLSQGIIGYICGSEGLDSSGLSSSAAVGVAYLLAFETANGLLVPPIDNIEYDRIIENEYLGLKNGILDQSAILLSSDGCLTCMNCQTKEHKLVPSPKFQKSDKNGLQRSYKILLAFSGLKKALTNSPGYNLRVTECQEAARILLKASGNDQAEPRLGNVGMEAYETHKVMQLCHLYVIILAISGLEAWASGDLEGFGKLISASGLSSIQNYECGCEPLIQLYEILLRAPGVLGARFSGAGFRGCCVAFVDADLAAQAAAFVKEEYFKVQPELANQINPNAVVLICESADSARVL